MPLTPNQLKMVTEAIGDDSDWPKMTADPVVNCEVDHLINGDPPWDFLPEDERAIYRKEATEFAKPVS